MIDAYDSLGIDLDAKDEDIKKAYRKLSLQHHPDKVQSSNTRKAGQDIGDKFNEIKLARDILQDAERRKLYDTFGIDLGEDRPEMEVWNIGMGTLVGPIGSFVLKTVVARLALWLVGFRWIGGLLLLLGVIIVLLYFANIEIRGIRTRSPDLFPILVNAGIIDAVVLIHWIWPLLADTATIIFLVSEVIGLQIMLNSWKEIVGSIVGSFFLAWLVRGWWFWIIVLEVLLIVVVFVAVTIAAGIMRLWIDSVQAQRSEQVRQHRLAMRKLRASLENEVITATTQIMELKQKLGSK